MSLLARVAMFSPFGPILEKELRITARRKRSYYLRVGYLGLLLLVLLMAYTTAGRYSGGRARQAQQQADLGLLFFRSFAMFSLVAMGLIAPVLTSTAIGAERLARTLPVLLMTPINTWQIVGGKLFSRMLAALTLLGLSLPVLALVRLLGGVELDQMLAVLCICTSFALSCAAIGLFCSALMNRAFAVILLAYMALLLLYVFVPFVLGIGLRVSDEHLYAAINPVFCMGVLLEGGLTLRMGISWAPCVGVQLVITTLLVAASAKVLRRSARTAGERGAAFDPQRDIPLLAPAYRGGIGLPPPLPAAGDGATMESASPSSAPAGVLPYAAPPKAAGPLSAALRRRRAWVWDNPVLWREVNRPMMPKPWQNRVGAIFSIGLLLLTYAVLSKDDSLDRPTSQIGYAIVFNFLGWLLVAVLSATAIASERESDTWTLLLATPISGSAVVWGKVAGLYRRMLWPLALVVAHFALFTLSGIISPWAMVLVLWVMLTFNPIWVATGIWFSLRFKRTTFAVIANLLLAVVLYGVSAVAIFIVGQLLDGRRGESWVEIVNWVLPYFYLGSGLDSLARSTRYSVGADFSLPWRGHEVTGAEFGITVVVVGLIHLAVAYAILARMAASFDRIVGRAHSKATTAHNPA